MVPSGYGGRASAPSSPMRGASFCARGAAPPATPTTALVAAAQAAAAQASAAEGSAPGNLAACCPPALAFGRVQAWQEREMRQWLVRLGLMVEPGEEQLPLLVNPYR